MFYVQHLTAAGIRADDHSAIAADTLQIERLAPGRGHVYRLAIVGLKPEGVRVNFQNRAVVFGEFTADSAQIGPFITQRKTGDRVIFAMMLDTSGQMMWFRQIAALDGDVQLGGAAMDGYGSLFLAFSFNGSIRTNNFLKTSSGDYDIMAYCLDSAGMEMFAREAGGPGLDMATAIAVDLLGNCAVAGTASDDIFFNKVRLPAAGGGDAFVWRLSPFGDMVYAHSIGSEGPDSVSAMVMEPGGITYIAGSFYGAGIAQGLETYANPYGAGQGAGFLFSLERLNPSVRNFRIIGEDMHISQLTLSPTGELYLAGRLEKEIKWGRFTLQPVMNKPTWFVAAGDIRGGNYWGVTGDPADSTTLTIATDGDSNKLRIYITTGSAEIHLGNRSLNVGAGGGSAIADITLGTRVSTAPAPAAGRAFISGDMLFTGEPLRYAIITNTLGQIYYEGAASTGGISLSRYPKGVFVFKGVSTAGQTVQLKFVRP